MNLLPSRFSFRVLALLVTFAAMLRAADPSLESVEAKEKRLEWFRHDKYGLFIHWGIYSILADGEWVMLREDPDFHQRFVGVVTPDRIDGHWDASEDGGTTWRKDFDLIFERATGD